MTTDAQPSAMETERAAAAAADAAAAAAAAAAATTTTSSTAATFAIEGEDHTLANALRFHLNKK